MAYVDAMYDWELRAFESTRGGEIGEEVRAALRAIREAYLTTRALATNTSVSFGSAPGFDTDSLAVLEVEERDRSHARVTTGEFPFDTARHGLSPQEHEYRLVRVDGRWRLNSRTTKDWDGHVIRGLL